jgi:hypothetical protein
MEGLSGLVANQWHSTKLPETYFAFHLVDIKFTRLLFPPLELPFSLFSHKKLAE